MNNKIEFFIPALGQLLSNLGSLKIVHIITSHKPEKPKPAVSQFVFVCMSVGNTCERVSAAFHGKTGGPNWMKPYSNLVGMRYQGLLPLRFVRRFKVADVL